MYNVQLYYCAIHTCVWRRVFLQLTAGEWTFSLRISSARCGNAAPCDGYILAVCLRPLGTVRADGHSCYLFIAGTANELMERDLTSLDEVNSTVRKGRIYLAIVIASCCICMQLMRDGRPYVTRSFPYRVSSSHYSYLCFFSKCCVCWTGRGSALYCSAN